MFVARDDALLGQDACSSIATDLNLFTKA